MRTQVAVVGAGVAGLALAHRLSAAGIDCVVLERAAEIVPVGAGIQLSPNGVRILQALGCAPTLERDGVRVEAIEVRDGLDGRLLSRVGHGADCAARYGAPYYVIHRADLHRALCATVPDAVVRLSSEVVDVVSSADHATVLLRDGRRVDADVVVGCDGVHSVVRESLVRAGGFAMAPEAYSGHVVHRAVVRAELAPFVARRGGVQFWLGEGAHVTAYPVGAGRTVHVSAVSQQPEPEHARDGRASLAGLLRRFEGWHDDVRAVLGAAVELSRWALHDRPVPLRFSHGRVVLVGDAAHPTLPYMSQGANQALEDADLLATALVQQLTPGPRSRLHTPVDLTAYEARRRPRVTAVHAAARARAASFHLPVGPERDARDLRLAGDDLDGLAWLYDPVEGQPTTSPPDRADRPDRPARRTLASIGRP